jgi:tetratricopeptide (TPR) repeat protein
MEEEVASRIARSLSIVLPQTHNRRSSTANAAAYDDYLKGRYYWNRRTEEGFNQAIDYFQQAIAIDPAYAEPYAGLADSYNLFIEYFDLGSTTEFARRSEQAAQKAVELDETLAEGHAALGLICGAINGISQPPNGSSVKPSTWIPIMPMRITGMAFISLHAAASAKGEPSSRRQGRSIRCR